MEQIQKNVNLRISRNGVFLEERQINEGTLLYDIAKDYDTDPECRILVGLDNKEIMELNRKIGHDIDELDFKTAESFYGYRTLERALLFVFIRAVYEITGVKSKVRIEHSLDKGLYCEVDTYNGWLTDEVTEKIQNRMKEIIEADEKFEKFTITKKEAKAVLSDYYDSDDLDLIDYNAGDYVNVYKCGWVWDYFYGPLPVSTGCITVFGLIRLENGLLLRLPKTSNPRELPKFKHDRMMSEIFKESRNWMGIIGIPYVSDLNRTVKDGTYRRVIQISEALHEKKIAKIADSIAAMKKRIILIAGPSSSGKTSFAQRLSVQLNVQGIKTCTLSTDDYFINRVSIKKDKNGNYNFEDLSAVDVDLFNKQLNMLLEGQEVDLPTYDFILGEKKFGKRLKRLDSDETVIIEGIHALNEALTPQIKAKEKFKIYISPLTSLGIDAHNRIPTSDARLFRRLIRDYRTRGKSAQQTLESWKEVRAGEERNIFPFQEEADVMFNSVLPYELSVLKKYVKPILESVNAGEPEYIDAQRLLNMLSYFLELPDEQAILNNSLLKEFIGGTCLFED